MKNPKEILEYIIANGTCTELGQLTLITCKESNLPACPLYSEEIKRCLIFKRETYKRIASEKLEEIKKLEFLEQLK